MKLRAIALLGVLICSALLAQEKSVIEGAGSFPCSAMNADLNADIPVNGRSWYLSWAQGFLSAMNVQRGLAGDAQIDLDLADPVGQFTWLANYCKDRPQDYFHVAVFALYQVLADRQGVSLTSP